MAIEKAQRLNLQIAKHKPTGTDRSCNSVSRHELPAGFVQLNGAENSRLGPAAIGRWYDTTPNMVESLDSSVCFCRPANRVGGGDEGLRKEGGTNGHIPWAQPALTDTVPRTKMEIGRERIVQCKSRIRRNPPPPPPPVLIAPWRRAAGWPKEKLAIESLTQKQPGGGGGREGGRPFYLGSSSSTNWPGRSWGAHTRTRIAWEKQRNREREREREFWGHQKAPGGKRPKEKIALVLTTPPSLPPSYSQVSVHFC